MSDVRGKSATAMSQRIARIGAHGCFERPDRGLQRRSQIALVMRAHPNCNLHRLTELCFEFDQVC
jgi:hypothetical protein